MSGRVAVIGAGHHGLVAAIRLSARGYDVVVLERSAVPGGAVGSAELTLPGFVHDTCAGFFPLTAASPVFAQLGLELDWVNPAIPMVHVLSAEGEAIALHRDVEATGGGRRWRGLVRTLWPARHAVIRAGLALPPFALPSSARLGRVLFGDDGATAWLAGSGAHADVSPYGAGSGAFSFGLTFLGHVVGWPFPRGGAGRLTDVLVTRLGLLGGSVRCGAPVSAIEVQRSRVQAVRLVGGERIPVDAVISTVSPGVLSELLPPGALPGRVERRLKRWRYGLGTVKLDYALAGPVPWAAPQAREGAVVHVGGPLAEITASLEQAGVGRFPDRLTLVVGQQSLHDRSRVPEATGETLYVYARVPQRPGLGDDEMAERIEARIEQFAPGFRSLIRARAVRSPAAIEAANPSLRGGDLASGSCAVDQQFVFRPAPALYRGRTPLPGLYVGGAWVHPGPGVHGLSGWAAAGALLADQSGRA